MSERVSEITLVYAGARQVHGLGIRHVYYEVVEGEIAERLDNADNRIIFARPVLKGMPGMMLTAERVDDNSFRKFRFLPQRWPDTAQAAGWRAEEEAVLLYAKAGKMAAENPLIELVKPLRAAYHDTAPMHRTVFLAAIIRAITG